MHGLTFNSKHSYYDLGLIMKSADRSLLPEVKKQQIDIQTLDGSFDMQREPVYSNRAITVTFSFKFRALEQLREKQREIAYWLSGRSRLTFDDEPDKYYDAKVFDSLSLVQNLKFITFQAVFECQAFALAANYSYSTYVYEETPFIFSVTSKGNQKTP